MPSVVAGMDRAMSDSDPYHPRASPPGASSLRLRSPAAGYRMTGVSDHGPMNPPTSITEPAARLRGAVRSSSLAIAIVQLPTRRFVELSARAAAFLGSDPLVLRGTDALAVSNDPEASGRAFAVIANGLLDGYQARRSLRGGGGAVDSSIWTRVLRRTGASADLVVVLTPLRGEPDGSPDAHDDAHDDQGALEHRVVPLLDIVHPDDVATVLTAIEEATASRAQVAVVVHLRDEAGTWQRSRISLGPVDDATRNFAFALTPAIDTTVPAPPGERVMELEQRLRRIAREVEAAGVVTDFGRVPDPEAVPGLEDLTPRQREVVNRLFRGERVPEIARGMYLSPSTVRNHLASLFRKVGVHSQTEFLDVLRRRQ
jgi:DNA-binding NarL/FixJ family response regulator